MKISPATISIKTSPPNNHLEILLQQDGPWATARLTNRGGESVCVQEIQLAELGPFDRHCRLYGEGFQMLAQYVGTVDSSACLTPYGDRNHCRLPETPGATTFYNLLQLELGPDDHLLLAFASCRRFSGEFRLATDGTCRVVLDAEGIRMEAGETWLLEEFGILRGPELTALYDQLAERIVRHHPPRDLSQSPTGWCSWYCFGPKLSDADIYRNLTAIQENKLPLRYIQIDDGYEAKLGDWETCAPGFPDGLVPLVAKIREAGCEPAIWLAPFIAEKDSDILRDHPEWFIADENGQPLPSDRVSFGGWRAGPWYCLDGSHPGAQKHLQEMPKYFREKFGCRYFKLDALFWGTLHGGHFHDPKATRIEAYRRGMEAFNRGAGEDGYVLGCNASLWPSLGLVNGMRVTCDIFRSWESIRTVAQEQFFRNWQHGKLWINDPDCVCLDEGDLTYPTPAELRQQGTSPATLAEFYCHAAIILASGGVVLSGDNVPSLSMTKLELLKNLITFPKIAARFKPFDFNEGSFTDAKGLLWRIFFNWEDVPKEIEIGNPPAGEWQALWTENGAGFVENRRSSVIRIPAHTSFVVHTSKTTVC